MKKSAKKEKQYTITLNEHQLITLEQMTEAYSRLICGQLSMSLRDVCENAWEKNYKRDHPKENSRGIGTSEWYTMRDTVERLCDVLKRICWSLNRNSDYGINYDDTSDELWDMYQVIRKFRYDNIFTDEERETMKYTVMADTPLHTSEQPLIIVEQKK